MTDQQQSSIQITAQGLADRLGLPWTFDGALDRDEAELTTEHARVSYGQPVLVRDSIAYGPHDLPGVTLHISTTNQEGAAELAAAAAAAGWTVRLLAYCDWCGNALSAPETRRPGDTHPACAETATRVRAQMAAPGYTPIPLDEYRAR